jgi:hypothetical protein
MLKGYEAPSVTRNQARRTEVIDIDNIYLESLLAPGCRDFN